MASQPTAITETSRVRDHVLALIREGTLTDDTPIFSERQLCDATKTSRTTVRRAMRELVDSGLLVPRRGKGTFVNAAALDAHRHRRIAAGTFGLLFFGQRITGPVDAFGWIMLQAVSRAAGVAGWSLMHLEAGDPGALAADRIAERGLDGVLWVSPSLSHESTVQHLRDRGLPVMLVNKNFSSEPAHSVVTDARQAGFLAGEALARRGHRSVVFVGRDPDRRHVAQRYEGFRTALLAAGMVHNPELVVDTCPAEATGERMRSFLKVGRDFSAVFVADELYLPYVLAELQAAGKRIPDEVSLLAHGQDFSPWGPFGIHPDHIRSPLDEVGALAVARLVELVEGRRQGTVRETLHPVYVSGDTLRDHS